MVFLRWGVFGMLTFAAVYLVYNSSKQLANRHERAGGAVVVPTPSTVQYSGPVIDACEGEIAVARRALDAHASGDPLDRLLRSREISFEEDADRRARLTRVARRWFEYPGPIDDATLRNTVYAECEKPRSP
jgi:hypothetical protein